MRATVNGVNDDPPGGRYAIDCGVRVGRSLRKPLTACTRVAGYVSDLLYRPLSVSAG